MADFIVTVNQTTAPLPVIAPFQQIAIVGPLSVSSSFASTASYAVNATTAATASLVSAANVSGTLADSKLTTNVPLKNTANVFTATNIFPLVSASNFVAGASSSAGSDISINGAAGNYRTVRFLTGNQRRWFMGADTSTESGNDAGSQFVLWAYNDSDVRIDQTLQIPRAAGSAMLLTRPLNVTGGSVTIPNGTLTTGNGTITFGTAAGLNSTLVLNGGTGTSNLALRGSGSTLTWQSSLADSWIQYMNQADPHLYIRDVVNARMHVTYTPSATTPISSFNSFLRFDTDNAYDIGVAGSNRPRNLYLAGTGTIAGGMVVTGSLSVGSDGGAVSDTTAAIFRNDNLSYLQSLSILLGAGTGSSGNKMITLQGGSSTGGLRFVRGATEVFRFDNSTGHFLFGADNTYDIGSSASNRPRDVYIANNVVATGGSPVFGATGLSSFNITLNANTGSFKGLTYQSNGSNRWSAFVNGGESTGNVGANFTLAAYDDTGTIIDSPLSIVRAAGGLISTTRPTLLQGVSTHGSQIVLSGSLGGLGPATRYIGHGGDANLMYFNTPAVNGAFSFAIGESTKFSINNTGNVSIFGGSLFVSGTVTANGTSHVFGTTGNNGTALILNANTGSNRDFQFQSNGLNRWVLRVTNAETGTNSGADFQVISRDDTGAFLDTPIAITRAQSGGVTLGRTVVFSSDNAFDIGALGSGRVHSIFAGTAMWTPAVGGVSGTQLTLYSNGSGRWIVDTSGNLVAAADNTYDIGNAGNSRARNMYVAGTGTFGGALTATTHNATVSGSAYQIAGATVLSRTATVGGTMLTSPQVASLANGASQTLENYSCGYLFVTGNGNESCIVLLKGYAGGAPVFIYNDGNFSGTKDTAGKINIYGDGTATAFIMQNNFGALRSFRITYIGA